jgi:hypothetical protein
VKKFEKWIKNNFSFNLSINFENTKWVRAAGWLEASFFKGS